MAETEVIQVNFWKEMHKDIVNTIEDIHGLVLLTHNSIEFSDIVDFLNNIKKDEYVVILYISLVNSYDKMKKIMEMKPLDSKKFFVVDCVSNFITAYQDTHDCIYRNPPHNLDEMKDLIMDNIKKSNPNIVVLDSLSQFINFSMPNNVELHNFYEFLKSIRKDVMGITNDTFILLYDDKVGSMRKLPTLFTDSIFKLEVIREKIEWQD
jgi:hypothetical protein